MGIDNDCSRDIWDNLVGQSSYGKLNIGLRAVNGYTRFSYPGDLGCHIACFMATGTFLSNNAGIAHGNNNENNENNDSIDNKVSNNANHVMERMGRRASLGRGGAGNHNGGCFNLRGMGARHVRACRDHPAIGDFQFAYLESKDRNTHLGKEEMNE